MPALFAKGHDRPGIVAELSRALWELEANLEDSEMTILSGYFTVFLSFKLPLNSSREEVMSKLETVKQTLGLDSLEIDFDSSHPRVEPEANYLITVYGSDQPGLVYTLSSLLLNYGINIVSLKTRIIGGFEGYMYMMSLAVTMPEQVNIEAFKEALKAAERQGLDVDLEALD